MNARALLTPLVLVLLAHPAGATSRSISEPYIGRTAAAEGDMLLGDCGATLNLGGVCVLVDDAASLDVVATDDAGRPVMAFVGFLDGRGTPMRGTAHFVCGSEDGIPIPPGASGFTVAIQDPASAIRCHPEPGLLGLLGWRPYGPMGTVTVTLHEA